VHDERLAVVNTQMDGDGRSCSQDTHGEGRDPEAARPGPGPDHEPNCHAHHEDAPREDLNAEHADEPKPSSAPTTFHAIPPFATGHRTSRSPRVRLAAL